MTNAPLMLPDAITVSLDIIEQQGIANTLISNNGFWSLLGIIGGGFVTYLTQYYLTRKQHEKRRKALSCAFYGEVYSLLKLAQMRQYYEMVTNTVLYIDQNNDFPHLDKFFSMQFDDYFAVYRQNVKDIGDLDSEVAPLLTEFYINVFSLLEDLTMIPGATLQHASTMYSGKEVQTAYVENLRSSLMEDIILIHKAIMLGSEICQRISAKYDLGYTPIFKELKPLEEIIKALNPDKNINEVLNSFEVASEVIYNVKTMEICKNEKRNLI